MLGYLSLDIICSSKLTVFLELSSRKTVRFSEQIMSADKYPSIFSRQMETIVIYPTSFFSVLWKSFWNLDWSNVKFLQKQQRIQLDQRYKAPDIPKFGTVFNQTGATYGENT